MKKLIFCISMCLCVLLGINTTFASGSNVELCDSNGQGYGYKISTNIIYDDSYNEKLNAQLGKNMVLVTIIDAYFIIDGQKIYSLDGMVDDNRKLITVKIPINGIIKENYLIYTFDGDKFEKVQTQVKNDYICYTTNTLQKVYVVNNTNYFSPWMIVISCVVIIMLLALLVYYFKIRRDMANEQTIAKNKEIEIEE